MEGTSIAMTVILIRKNFVAVYLTNERLCSYNLLLVVVCGCISFKWFYQGWLLPQSSFKMLFCRLHARARLNRLNFWIGLL